MKRTIRLPILFSPAEHDSARRRAAAKGHGIAAYLRFLLASPEPEPPHLLTFPVVKLDEHVKPFASAGTASVDATLVRSAVDQNDWSCVILDADGKTICWVAATAKEVLAARALALGEGPRWSASEIIAAGDRARQDLDSSRDHQLLDHFLLNCVLPQLGQASQAEVGR